MYPFADGDLRDSAVCLQNYMENATGKVPWEDLRYVVGQIRACRRVGGEKGVG